MMGDACCAHDQVPSPEGVEEHEAAPERLRDVPELRAAALAGVLLVAGWLSGRLVAGTGGDRAALGFELAALVVGGATFVPDAVRALVRGRLGVGTLMTIAAVGAVLLGEVGEAAGLAFLFSISEGLEGYSLARTRRGLRSLLSLVPQRATVLHPGGEVSVDPGELRPGDHMLVRPGERVATDGVIRTGRSALDVSAITGESMPVEAGPGDAAYAGTINGGGVLEVEVTATTEDSSLARIVHIVEEAQERKGVTQRLADRVARPLVPGVMVLAVLVAVVGSVLGDPAVWLERALVVLVAAAPCALAISVPVAVVTAIGAASRLGVLIKGGAALEALGAVDTVAFDKTGTLTRNRPLLFDVAVVAGHDPDRVLGLAAAVEARSEHPLAAAIVAAATVAGQDLAPPVDVEAVPGSGLGGRVDGHEVRLGRPGYLDAGPLAEAVAGMQHAGATAVIVEVDRTVVGALAVRDELRPEAGDAVAALRQQGVEVLLLTGDNARTAAALGAAVGVAEVRADLRPEDKATVVEQLRAAGRRVAMVGDGINDAPALATADIGIAMAAMGSDVAIETADVALMGEDLLHLPQVLAHARHARRVMVQNLVMSGGILLTLVPLAATGVLGLAAVVLAHELAEVLVIANGVRAGRRRSLPDTGTAALSRSTPSATPDVPPTGTASERATARS